MTLNEYQSLALRTAPDATPAHDLLHAGLGFATEGGEFLDVLKKEHAYGKPIDRVNLKEEIGDMIWYAAVGCRGLGITLEEAAQANIVKLSTRYPDKFTFDAALNRDLIAERAVLEEEGLSAPVLHSPPAPAKKTFTETLKAPPTRITLGSAMILEHRVDPSIGPDHSAWVVLQNGRVVAETHPPGRSLILIEGVNDGPWFYAAQQTLNTLLKK